MAAAPTRQPIHRGWHGCGAAPSDGSAFTHQATHRPGVQGLRPGRGPHAGGDAWRKQADGSLAIQQALWLDMGGMSVLAP